MIEAERSVLWLLSTVIVYICTISEHHEQSCCAYTVYKPSCTVTVWERTGAELACNGSLPKCTCCFPKCTVADHKCTTWVRTLVDCYIRSVACTIRTFDWPHKYSSFPGMYIWRTNCTVDGKRPTVFESRHKREKRLWMTTLHNTCLYTMGNFIKQLLGSW